MPRRTCEMVAGAEQGDANRPASFGKMPGRNEAVAAIVTGSAQHDYRTRRPALLNFVGDSAAGIFHQFDDRFAGGHSQAVGFAHPADIE